MSYGEHTLYSKVTLYLNVLGVMCGVSYKRGFRYKHIKATFSIDLDEIQDFNEKVLS